MAGQDNRNPDEADSLWLSSLTVNDVDAAADVFKRFKGMGLDGPINF